MDPTILDIADVTQFMVDDSFIAASAGLERRFHPMTKPVDGPVISTTEPFETGYLNPVTTLFDPARKQWRMWYWSYGQSKLKFPYLGMGTQHLALSQDGIHWEKPSLDAFRINGDGRNNINSFPGNQPAPAGCVVFDEPHDPDPAKRYKLIYYPGYSYYLAYSADGIRWTPLQKDPVWPNGSGDGLEETYHFFNDEISGRYRGYMRVWRRHQTIRKLGVGESDDLIHWTGPKIIYEAGPEFGVGAQVYGMLVWTDGGLYWGMPWMYYVDEPLEERLRNNIRMKLLWSRDGLAWNSVFPDRDAIPMGEPGSFDGYMIIGSCPVVKLEDRWRVYYVGSAQAHDYEGPEFQCAVGLAEVRRGGFVSLHAEEDGSFITHRILFRGESFHINAATAKDGFIAAELLNDSGILIKGFTLKESDRFTGDSVDQRLSWAGRSDLSFLRGQYLRLRLKLRKADVYSFRVAGKKELFSQPLGPRPVRCGVCSAPPVIDGHLTDPCWMDFSHCGVADEFVKFEEVAPATVKTRVLMTYDEKQLYIAVECEEPLLDKLKSAASGQIDYNRDDLVEFRLNSPQQHGTHFHQLMVTAGGRKQHCWFSKEAGGLAIHEQINWEAKISSVPGRWCIEMAVPFASLDTPPPKPGEQWKLNIIRYRYVEGSDISCWSCMFGSVHRNDLSGTLLFV